MRLISLYVFVEHIMQLENFKENEAHVWYAEVDSVSGPGVLRSCEEILSKEEREKAYRYHFSSDQHTALITRAMIRSLLSHYVSVEPSQWRFGFNQYGRPEIAKPEKANNLRFNIAHTSGFIAIVISKNREVGIDVERLPYIGPYIEIASRFFAPSEISMLGCLPPSEQAVRFIEYWTLKESFVKARGMGLVIPLDEFSFQYVETSGKKIEANFSPSLNDSPERWHV